MYTPSFFAHTFTLSKRTNIFFQARYWELCSNRSKSRESHSEIGLYQHLLYLNNISLPVTLHYYHNIHDYPTSTNSRFRFSNFTSSSRSSSHTLSKGETSLMRRLELYLRIFVSRHQDILLTVQFKHIYVFIAHALKFFKHLHCTLSTHKSTPKYTSVTVAGTSSFLFSNCS